jgi:hypothetical protein
MTFVLAVVQVTRQHKWLCAGGPTTRQHKGPFLLAQSCWWVPRPPAKTGFSRQDKSFLPSEILKIDEVSKGASLSTGTTPTTKSTNVVKY